MDNILNYATSKLLTIEIYIKEKLTFCYPHHYISMWAHCDDRKIVVNYFWNALNSLYDEFTMITKVSDWGGINFIFDVTPEK